MKHLKVSIFFTILLLVLLLISCDAVFLPTGQKKEPSSLEINEALLKKDHQMSSEVSSAFQSEQQEKEQSSRETQKKKYEELQKNMQDSQMMDIAQQEFSKQSPNK